MHAIVRVLMIKNILFLVKRYTNIARGVESSGEDADGPMSRKTVGEKQL